MHELIVGKVTIPYSLRFSEKASRRRIVVTPEGVEVVAPVKDTEAAAVTFVESKRRWIFDRWRGIQEVVRASSSGPSRFVTGAKIPYRGRQMRLRVEPTLEARVRVEYRNGFIVHRPVDATEEDVRQALVAWLTEAVKQDVRRFVTKHAPKLGAAPSGIRVVELKEVWASCGRGGVLSFSWRLAFAPRAVLEYAVVHELCHVLHRSHGSQFEP